jgi:hypothetical protein
VRILFVAALHHPPQAGESTVRAKHSPEFPPSQAHHFWVRSLTQLGHTCSVFWRSTSAWPWATSRQTRMTQRMTVGRALGALASAMPAVNPDALLRNRRLVDHARQYRPEVIVLPGGNDVILPRTLARLKADHRAVLVYGCGTSPRLFSYSIERSAAALYDLVIANDQGHALEWQALGSPRVEVLPMSAVDPAFHYRRDLNPSELQRFGCEVGFVGTLVPRHLYSRRIEALEALRGFDLAIWSIHEVPPSLRAFYRGPTLGEEMMRAISGAKIVVNPHGDFMRYGGNLRLFEACGAGAMQITDDLPGVHQWFRAGEHLAIFMSATQLAAQVSHYLADHDERRRISAAGQAHVYAHHTYDERMARLMDRVAEIRGR